MAGVAGKGANFSNGLLKETKFHASNFEDANVFKVHGGNCQFVNANLNRANFNASSLPDCTFENSKMIEAKFVSAHLYSTNMQGVEAKGADLSFAHIWGVSPHQFEDVIGLVFNNKTEFSHWNREPYDKISEKECEEVRALWLKAGALNINSAC